MVLGLKNHDRHADLFLLGIRTRHTCSWRGAPPETMRISLIKADIVVWIVGTAFNWGPQEEEYKKASQIAFLSIAIAMLTRTTSDQSQNPPFTQSFTENGLASPPLSPFRGELLRPSEGWLQNPAWIGE